MVVGALLASAVTEYYNREEPLKHFVTSGKVGKNPDGTLWVAESTKDDVVFNYTMPASSVHTRYVYYSSISIVAVPNYSQEFELKQTEDGQYAVYYPARSATILVSDLASYESSRDKTILVHMYDLFSFSVGDVRVRQKIDDAPFAINGVVTLIHKDGTASISGYLLTVEKKHFIVMLNDDLDAVIAVNEINFEYK
jgi:hypothetical protein